MKIHWEHTKRIERYLDEEMDKNERIAFEAEMSSHPDLKKEVKFHRQLREDLEHAAERERMRKKMNQWSGDLNTSKPVKRKRSINWRTVSVAASFSLVLVAGSITVYHFINQQRIDKKIGKVLLSAQEESAAAFEAEAEKNEGVAPVRSNVATCFAISQNGYLLTTYHTVQGKTELRLEQHGAETKMYHAHVVRVDEQMDVALIRIDDSTFTGFGNIPYTIANQSPSLAQKVFSVGYPLKKDLVYSEGIVASATGYKSDTLSYQVSIIANPGNSGSPVWNERGELTGVLSSKNTDTDGETYVTQMAPVYALLKEVAAQDEHRDLQLPRRSALRGKTIPAQVQAVSPFVFIVRAVK